MPLGVPLCMSFCLPFGLPLGLRFWRRSLKAAALEWIDKFMKRSGPYIFAREEDGVLILPPNRVYKANKTGMQLITILKQGKKIGKLNIPDGLIAEDINRFFHDLSNLVEDSSPADVSSPAVESVPYSFSFTRLPILGEIAVTYRCNNSCLFCYAGCGTSGCTVGNGETELTTSEVKSIISLFKEEAKLPFFSFTGGEPLLRDDLEEFIRFARSIGLAVNLITNGTLATSARARKLFRAGLRTAQVSIESDSPDLHDRLTGNTGSFRATLEGIAALQKAGIEVQTNTTVSRMNRDSVHQLPRFLRSKNIRRFAMNLYIPTGDSPVTRDLFLPYSEIGETVEKLKLEARREGLQFFWYSPIPHCHYNPIARGLGNKSCAAMDGLLSVSPAGDVLPCSSYQEPMGNLLADPFQTIWYSRRAEYFKQKEFAPQPCKECASYTACQGACPIYWEYAGTEELTAGGVPCP